MKLIHFNYYLYCSLLLLMLVSPTACIEVQFPSISTEETNTLTVPCTIQNIGIYTSSAVLTNTVGSELSLIKLTESNYVYVFANIQFSDAGSYTCTVNITDDADVLVNRVSDTAYIDVNIPASITTHPTGGNFMNGTDIMLDCACRGYPLPNITWYKDNTSVVLSHRVNIINIASTASQLTSTLLIVDIIVSDAGHYHCAVLNSYSVLGSEVDNREVSASSYVTVYLLPTILYYSSNVFTVAHNSTNLFCEASGTAPLTFQWRDVYNKTLTADISISTSANSSMLIFNNPQLSDTGVYICIVDNKYGSTNATLSLLVVDRPSSPVNLNYSLVTARYVLIHWLQPLSDGNSPLLSYNIQTSASSNDYSLFAMTPASQTSLNISNINPYTTYLIRVSADNAIGASVYSTVLTVRTLEDIPDATVRDITHSDITSVSITLHITPPPSSKWNGAIIGLILHQLLILDLFNDTNNIMTIFTYPITPILLPHQEDDVIQIPVHNLEPYENYSYSIALYNAAGVSTTSQAYHVTTLQSIPDQAPTVQLITTTATTITIEWSTISMRRLNGILISYIIQYNSTANSLTNDLNVSADINYYVISNLFPFTEYSVRVAAVTIGYGPFSAYVTITTLEGIPSAPYNITIEYISYTSIRITWLPPVQINGILLMYTVYYCQVNDTGYYSNSTVTANLAEIQLEGLLDGATLLIYITATTNGGESTLQVPTRITPAFPPRLSSVNSTSVQHVVVQIHTDTNLTCPIIGLPIPYFRWLANNSVSSNNSFTVLPYTTAHLMISIDDIAYAGDYVCEGVNIFGALNYTFIVSVHQLPSVNMSLSYSNGFCDGNNEGYNCLLESNFTIECTVIGYPMPDVTIYRNTTLLAFNDTAYDSSSYQFTGAVIVGDLNTCQQSGEYTCIAVNIEGVGNKTLFINPIGQLAVSIINDTIIAWTLNTEGLVPGDYILQYGALSVNETEHTLNSSSRKVDLRNILSDVGEYLVRVVFRNTFGYAAFSETLKYSVISSTSPPATHFTQTDWFIAISILIAVLVVIAIIISLILFVLIMGVACSRWKLRNAVIEEYTNTAALPKSSAVAHSNYLITSNFAATDKEVSNIITHSNRSARNRALSQAMSGIKNTSGENSTYRKIQKYTREDSYLGRAPTSSLVQKAKHNPSTAI